MMHAKQSMWAVAICLAGMAGVAQAAEVAHWRHEEGAAGGFITAGADTVLDSSGSGNHMQTFDPAFTSATYTSAVSSLALRSGAANSLALDFGPGGDDAGLNDDNFTDGKPIQSHVFNAMTVELAFNMNSVGPGQYQALVGKDGCPLCGPPPDGSPVPPFKVLVRGDDFPNAVPNQLFIEWIDGDGEVHFVASGQSMIPGEWNHAAFVLTPTDAQLWMAGEAGHYTLLDSISGDFSGGAGEVLFNSPGTWTVGRGMFNGNIADWTNAIIDEVRISDVALGRGEFAFVPEPSAAMLGLLAICACSLMQRRD